jgi:hypothetical protein
MGIAAARVKLLTHTHGKFDFPQPRFEVASLSHYLLKCLPSASDDSVTFPISPPLSQGIRQTIEGITNRLPVTKVPGFKLLNNDTVEDYLWAQLRSKTARSRLELALKDLAIILVTVHKHKDAIVLRNPSVAKKPGTKLLEKIVLGSKWK